MNGAKTYHNKFGDQETFKLHHMLFPRHTIMAATLQFKQHPLSSLSLLRS